MPKLTKDLIKKANDFFTNIANSQCQKELVDNEKFNYKAIEYADKQIHYLRDPADSYKALAYMMASIKNQKGEMSDKEKEIYQENIKMLEETFGINEAQIKGAANYIGVRNAKIDAELFEINEDGSIFTVEQKKAKDLEEAEKNKKTPEQIKAERLKAFQEKVKKEDEEYQRMLDEEKAEKERQEREAKIEEENIKKQAEKEANQPYVDNLNKRKDDFEKGFNGHEKNNVLFDEKFFRDLYPGRIRTLVKDNAYPNDPQQPYEHTAGWRKEATEDADRYKDISGQRRAATSRFETYFGLRDKLESKSFLDILKHPLNTLREFIVMVGVKSDIKNAYGFSNKALDDTYEMIMGYNDGDNHIPENFGGMEKDGTIIKNKASKEEINEKINDIKNDKLKEKLVGKTQELREKISTSEKTQEKLLDVKKSDKATEKTIDEKKKDDIKIE